MKPSWLFCLGLLLVALSGCRSIHVTDIDGNVYQTVKIGDQVWMAENLRVTRYNDGTEIPKLTDHIEWFNTQGPAYCWYRNDFAANAEPFGAMYNWHALHAGDLCPEGWRVATVEDWKKLVDTLGGAEAAADALKDAGNDVWMKPNEGATNHSGFSALPGGFRYVDGSYVTQGYVGFWWTSTALPKEKGYVVIMRHDSSEVYFSDDRVGQGFSVRCIKE